MYICNYCGKDCKNPGGLANHKPYCKLNPNRIQKRNSPNAHKRKGAPTWNKGLNKFNDERIKKVSNKLKDKISKGIIVHKGTPHTEEYKIKARENAIKNNLGGYQYGAGRGKRGWYENEFFDSQWELAYWIYCREHNIDIKRNKKYYIYEYKNKKYKYYPDFIVNGELVEIKGYHNNLVDLKLNCVHEPIKILYEKDLDYIFNYIELKYNLKKDKIYKLYNKEAIRLDEGPDLKSGNTLKGIGGASPSASASL